MLQCINRGTEWKFVIYIPRNGISVEAEVCPYSIKMPKIFLKFKVFETSMKKYKNQTYLPAS